MVELAANGSSESSPAKGEAVAVAQSIPLRFLENILGELRIHGLAQSRRGSEGGYWLARPAAELTIAEIVRAGILAVAQGQWEAAQALGLKPGVVLRQIVLPQALRVIVPPMTSQFLNLTKNSSLAVAIGYQDIVSIANTTLNQTGQAIEGIAIIMLVYLTISLSISLFMNWYNSRIALVER